METQIADQGITQEVVCDDFLIDHKTVWRWLKRGYLNKSKDGHIDPNYKIDLLPLWESTCEPIEVEEKLMVNSKTSRRNLKLLKNFGKSKALQK